jgi:hypothetical protein
MSSRTIIIAFALTGLALVSASASQLSAAVDYPVVSKEQQEFCRKSPRVNQACENNLRTGDQFEASLVITCCFLQTPPEQHREYTLPACCLDVPVLNLTDVETSRKFWQCNSEITSDRQPRLVHSTWVLASREVKDTCADIRATYSTFVLHDVQTKVVEANDKAGKLQTSFDAQQLTLNAVEAMVKGNFTLFNDSFAKISQNFTNIEAAQAEGFAQLLVWTNFKTWAWGNIPSVATHAVCFVLAQILLCQYAKQAYGADFNTLVYLVVVLAATSLKWTAFYTWVPTHNTEVWSAQLMLPFLEACFVWFSKKAHGIAPGGGGIGGGSAGIPDFTKEQLMWLDKGLRLLGNTQKTFANGIHTRLSDVEASVFSHKMPPTKMERVSAATEPAVHIRLSNGKLHKVANRVTYSPEDEVYATCAINWAAYKREQANTAPAPGAGGVVAVKVEGEADNEPWYVVVYNHILPEAVANMKSAVVWVVERSIFVVALGAIVFALYGRYSK